MFPKRLTPLLLLISLPPPTLSIPQGVTSVIRPPGGSPPGCTDTSTEPFGITAVTSLGLSPQVACIGETTLRMTLSNGVLVDSLGRIGSIVANRQFQFDGPPAQAGAIFTGGWGVCDDFLLALGLQKIFYSCESGDFKNLYDQAIASYCQAVFLQVVKLVQC